MIPMLVGELTLGDVVNAHAPGNNSKELGVSLSTLQAGGFGIELAKGFVLNVPFAKGLGLFVFGLGYFFWSRWANGKTERKGGPFLLLFIAHASPYVDLKV
jgi:hypothetical protein